MRVRRCAAMRAMRAMRGSKVKCSATQNRKSFLPPNIIIEGRAGAHATRYPDRCAAAGVLAARPYVRLGSVRCACCSRTAPLAHVTVSGYPRGWVRVMARPRPRPRARVTVSGYAPASAPPVRPPTIHVAGHCLHPAPLHPGCADGTSAAARLPPRVPRCRARLGGHVHVHAHVRAHGEGMAVCACAAAARACVRAGMERTALAAGLLPVEAMAAAAAAAAACL